MANLGRRHCDSTRRDAQTCRPSTGGRCCIRSPHLSNLPLFCTPSLLKRQEREKNNSPKSKVVRTTERGVKEEHTEQTWGNSPREGSEEDQKPKKGRWDIREKQTNLFKVRQASPGKGSQKKKDVRWVQQTGRNIRKASQPPLPTGEQTGVMEFAGEERERDGKCRNPTYVSRKPLRFLRMTGLPRVVNNRTTLKKKLAYR